MLFISRLEEVVGLLWSSVAQGLHAHKIMFDRLEMQFPRYVREPLFFSRGIKSRLMNSLFLGKEMLPQLFSGY